MAKRKTVLTTGEIAKICNVAPRTVSKWFDSGRLRGYRIPGSRDRRVPVEQLIRFMRAHDIPLNGLDSGKTRVLAVDSNRDLLELLVTALDAQGFDVRAAGTLFEAGMAAAEFHPNVILLDTDLPGLMVRDVLRTIRSAPEMVGARVIALTGGGSDAPRQAREEGFDAAVSKPFDASQIVRVIEETAGALS
ncbi:MAG: response regulator [Phycisphaerae bacterium]|nr:response regulator [Phycisphaerae bacterium]